jgi:hypothetical protein
LVSSRIKDDFEVIASKGRAIRRKAPKFSLPSPSGGVFPKQASD